MKPYRIDEDSSDNSDVVDLHYDLLESDDFSQGIQALTTLLKEKEDDLRLLSHSNNALLLDLGINTYEDEYSKNLDFGSGFLKILSEHEISLRVALYYTSRDDR